MWDESLEKKVTALTPEQINAAMKKYLSMDRLNIIKAGDFAKAKNAGKIRVLSVKIKKAGKPASLSFYRNQCLSVVRNEYFRCLEFLILPVEGVRKYVMSR